jgi:hypothetical protein
MLWKRKTPPKSSESEWESPPVLEIEQPVWFFLIEVRVTGPSKQPWIAGSKALVQAFVPGTNLERSLAQLDAFLPSEELERIDTLRADRFEPHQEDPNIPGEYFLTPLQRAARNSEVVLGIFVVSKDSAWPHETVS